MSESQRLTTEEFITRAHSVHGEKYDYSNVEYINSKTKVCIIDLDHGEFWQEPTSHLGGCGNPIRARRRVRKILSHTVEQFIKKATQVHDYRYNYSNVNYINIDTKVCIIDPDHGEFWQVPYSHLQGAGHPIRGNKIAGYNNRLSTETFVKRANQIHNYLYDYSNVEYINSKTKVCIIDPMHGEWWQTPNNHLAGYGCPERSYNGKNSLHKDHIIPLAIIGRENKNRPLYKFLDGDINIQRISGADNILKNDWIEYKGKSIRARDYQNDYRIIANLSKNLLNCDITDIIEEDKAFMDRSKA